MRLGKIIFYFHIILNLIFADSQFYLLIDYPIRPKPYFRSKDICMDGRVCEIIPERLQGRIEYIIILV